MDQSLFTYDIIAEDSKTHARAGVLHTPHGDIETPIFMPVGTRATVKGVPWETVKDRAAALRKPPSTWARRSSSLTPTTWPCAPARTSSTRWAVSTAS